jgi:hypothetical protein
MEVSHLQKEMRLSVSVESFVAHKMNPDAITGKRKVCFARTALVIGCALRWRESANAERAALWTIRSCD